MFENAFEYMKEEFLNIEVFLEHANPYSLEELENLALMNQNVELNIKDLKQLFKKKKQNAWIQSIVIGLPSVSFLFLNPIISLLIAGSGSIFILQNYFKKTKEIKNVLQKYESLKEKMIPFMNNYEQYKETSKSTLYPDIYIELINQISKLNYKDARNYLKQLNEIVKKYANSKEFFFKLKELLDKVILHPKKEECSVYEHELLGDSLIIEECFEYIKKSNHLNNVLNYTKIRIDAIEIEKDKEYLNQLLAQICLPILIENEEEIEHIFIADLPIYIKKELQKEFPDLQNKEPKEAIKEGIVRLKEVQLKL